MFFCLDIAEVGLTDFTVVGVTFKSAFNSLQVDNQENKTSRVVWYLCSEENVRSEEGGFILLLILAFPL